MPDIWGTDIQRDSEAKAAHEQPKGARSHHPRGTQLPVPLRPLQRP